MSDDLAPGANVSLVNPLQLTASEAEKALTPSQKKFNTLLRQIEKSRRTLGLWHENIAGYRKAHAEILTPLQTDLQAGHRRWAFALDAALTQKGWTRTEREFLRELICDAAADLLEGNGDDPELEDLFSRHAEVDFATQKREQALEMKKMAEAITGFELGEDDGIESESDLFQRLKQGFEARDDAQTAEQTAPPARRPKPTAAQQRREAEAQQATQSVREIYRKLASALHPDREADPAQREAKTALMQRVNQAHEAGDLLTLLELQLQIEQIDVNHIANLGDQRVKHYNKVLAEQLAGIKGEIEHVEFAFCMEFGLRPGWGLKPTELDRVLDQTRREWSAELARQQHELRMLGDVAATKRWLKRQQRQQQRDVEFDFMPF